MMFFSKLFWCYSFIWFFISLLIFGYIFFSSFVLRYIFFSSLYFGIKSLSCFMLWYICMLKCAIIICFICTFNIMEKTALVHWQEIKYSYFYIFLGINLWDFPYGLRYPRKFCDLIKKVLSRCFYTFLIMFSKSRPFTIFLIFSVHTSEVFTSLANKIRIIFN